MSPPRSTLLARRLLAATNAALGAAARLAWRRPRVFEPRRVCVWRTGNLGDLVCALPALAAVRRTWPAAELTLLTSPGTRGAPGAAELLEGAPWIDELWTYYPSELSARELAADLRRRDFDLVVRLPQNMSTPWRELRDLLFLRGWARVRRATGFAVGTLRWLGRGVARAQAADPALAHEADRLLALVEGWTVRAVDAEFPLPVTSAHRREATAILARFALEDVPLLALAPGAKRPTNRWPVERFAGVARRWLADGGRAVVLGGPGDRELGQQIAELAGPGVVDLCGESPILLSAALLEHVDVLVSGDTGAMHLASAVGTPSVVPFSARDLPRRWFPYASARLRGERAPVVLREAPECSPCWLESCPHDNRCLAGIEEERVWSRASGLRRSTRRGRSAAAV